MPSNPNPAFLALPSGLRSDLVTAFNEIVNNYQERRWEPSELNGGKLCEAAYTVIRGVADGLHTPRSNKPRNMVAACNAMEQETSQPRSIRIQIPRVIIALYEIRNNRGVGHSGGDVDPNEMDATAVLYMSKWLMAELIRVMHTTTTDQAQEIVDSLVERQVPIVWRDNHKKRVLKTGLTLKQNTLLLLLSEPGDVSEKDLIGWLESKNPASLRRDVLRPGHRERLWEYDATARTIRLLPPGVAAAETLVSTR